MQRYQHIKGGFMKIHLYVVFLFLLASLFGNANPAVELKEEEQIEVVNSNLQQIESLKNKIRFLSFYIDKLQRTDEAYCYPQSAAEALATYGAALNERFSAELNLAKRQNSNNCINLKIERSETRLLIQELTVALKGLSEAIKANLAVLVDIKLSTPDSKAATSIDNYFKNETKSINNLTIKKWGITTKQIGLGFLIAVFVILIYSGIAMMGAMPLGAVALMLGSAFGTHLLVGKISDLSSDKDKIRNEIQLSNDLIKTYKSKILKNSNVDDLKVELRVLP